MLFQKFLKKLRGIQTKLLSISLIYIIITIALIFIFPAFSQQPVTLNILMSAADAKPWRQGIIKDFEFQNPGIRINLVEGPNATNLREDLYTSAFILGNSPYDLIYMDVIWTSKFASAGWLQDLTDRISQAELTVLCK